MKWTGIGVGAVALLGVACVIGLLSGGQDGPAVAQTTPTVAQTVNVSGEGRVSARPDMALLTLGAAGRGVTVAEAMAQANQATDRIRDTLRANGIDERDVQTVSILVNPQFRRGPSPEDGPPPIVGYQATQQLQVKARDVTAAGKIIDDAATAAGDRFQMQGLRFTFADPTPLQSQAREQAMAKAKAKAEELARIGGLTLGPPIAINEGTQPPSIATARGGDVAFTAAPAPVPPTGVSPGELEVVVVVQVNYSAR